MPLTIEPKHIERLFPAYIRLDEAGRITRTGSSLRQHLGDDIIGKPLLDVFALESPRRVACATALSDGREITLVSLKETSLVRLRGLVLRSPDHFALLVGHIPNVDSASATSQLGMADFSPADASLDLLVATHMSYGLLQEAKDIARALKKKSRAIELLAYEDALTGLPNRRGFFRAFSRALDTCISGNRDLVIGVIDLDGFKAVNDVFGHAAGDQLLRETGERLRSILGKDTLLCRLGGDEFGFVLTDTLPATRILTGERICEALARPFHLPQGTARVAGSIGMAAFPESGNEAATLYERADYALYHSKQNARGTTVMFNSDHEREIRWQAAIGQKLMEACDDEFYLVYQPIIDGKSGLPAGFEALARWRNVDLGRVRPDHFIRAAEQNGTIGRLTRILLRKALSEALEWPDNYSLSFNLSAIDIVSNETTGELREIIRDSGFPPERLVLEITETALLHDFEHAVHGIEQFAAMGIRVALDDFGSGFSSLVYLQRIPIDRLKIDLSFTSHLETSKSNRDIMRHILALCSDLKIDCVVEGVETPSQAEILRGMKAPLLQGYYFARPMQAAQLLAYITLCELAPQQVFADFDAKPALPDTQAIGRRRAS